MPTLLVLRSTAFFFVTQDAVLSVTGPARARLLGWLSERNVELLQETMITILYTSSDVFERSFIEQ